MTNYLLSFVKIARVPLGNNSTTKHEHIIFDFACLFPTMQIISKPGLSYFMIFAKRHHPDNRAEIGAML